MQWPKSPLAVPTTTRSQEASRSGQFAAGLASKGRQRARSAQRDEPPLARIVRGVLVRQAVQGVPAGVAVGCYALGRSQLAMGKTRREVSCLKTWVLIA